MFCSCANISKMFGPCITFCKSSVCFNIFFNVMSVLTFFQCYVHELTFFRCFICFNIFQCFILDEPEFNNATTHSPTYNQQPMEVPEQYFAEKIIQQDPKLFFAFVILFFFYFCVLMC